MRDINVTKYRKILYKLQYFCKEAKRSGCGYYDNGLFHITPMNNRINNKKKLTDFERGYIEGKHSAFNDVLRELHSMIVQAEYDWNRTHCREERYGD